MRKELRSRKADTVQAKIYHQLAVLTKYSDPQQSRAYAYAMLQLSEKLRYDKGQYGACRMLGELATIIGRKLDSAAYWYVSSLDFAARIKGNEQLLSLQETYNSLGGLYTDKGDFVAAIRYLNKADSIQPSPAEPSLNYDICNNYAFLYLDMGDVEKSLNKNREALRLAQSMPDEGSIANSCFNIGSCYRNAGLTRYNEGKSFRAELDSAIKYLHLSQAYFSANKHIYGLRAVHSELGNVYTALKDYDKAIAYCKENIVFNTQLKDTISLFETYCQIAQVYAYLKKRDSALTYLAKANTSGLQKVPKFQQSILYHTSIIYEKLGAYEQALLYYKQYKHFSDSLLAAEKEKQVSEIQTKYETSKKEKIIND
ncbi:MAG: tetratricopeptide repeat protein, partial [Chitinophagaceae bacterium]|nr:tetratricopeptide repeat protein [Chitinophagaceae bacterium]